MSLLLPRSEKVSERSLEFNVLSEALDIIHKLLGNAYIVGYTTRQEAYHGLDVSINAPGMVIAAYQFKAPTSGRGDTYRFTIGNRCWICSNPRLGSRSHPRREIAEVLRRLGLSESCVNQHTLLYTTSIVLENIMNIPVFYAFPLVRSYTELEQRIPGIIDYTVLIRVRDMPIRTVLDCRPHRVEVVLPANNPNNITILIRSEPEELPRDKFTILSKALKELIEKKNLPTASQYIHLEPKELQQILERELKKSAYQENLKPELIERAMLLAKAITMISFSYRGTALVAKS